jgi:hypothetical protein
MLRRIPSVKCWLHTNLQGKSVLLHAETQREWAHVGSCKLPSLPRSKSLRRSEKNGAQVSHPDAECTLLHLQSPRPKRTDIRKYPLAFNIFVNGGCIHDAVRCAKSVRNLGRRCLARAWPITSCFRGNCSRIVAAATLVSG